MTSSAIFGRREEHERLKERLSSSPGLVTLTGPGGVGKTTLALGVMRALANAAPFGGRALFVDLSEASSHDGVVGRVGLALGVSVEGVRTLREAAERLGVALQERGAALIVLDNAEQVVRAVGALAEGWSRAAPELRMLITSREPLGADGEELVPLDVLSREDAVALFEERAREARPSFAVTDDERGTLLELVEQLDCLPLALELAAARLEVLSLEQLKERLVHKLRLLKSVEPRGPERHRALAATIAWSWELLDDNEQETLRQTSVFRGGFSLEAAEAVVRPSGDVLDALHALKRKSLVVLHAGPAPRFSLLETVRAFAAERLDEHSSRPQVEERHGRYFADLARRAADPKSLAVETDNLVAAHRYARAAVPAEAARLGLFLARLLAPRVPVSMRVSLLDAAVEDADAAGVDEMRASARIERGEVQRARGEHAAAERDLEEAARLLPDEEATRPLRAALFSARGALLGQRGELGPADDALEQALKLSEAALEVRAVVLMRRFALRIVEERLKDAEPLGHEALALLERAGDLRSVGVTLGNLAALQLELGRLDEACATATRAREVQRAFGDPLSECMSLLSAALAHVDAGRAPDGLACASEALELAERQGDRRISGFAHASRGLALELGGALEEAIDSLARAEALASEDDAIAARFHPRAYRSVLIARQGDPAVSNSLMATVDLDAGPPGARVARAFLLAAQRLAVARDEPSRTAAETAARALLDEERAAIGVHPRLARRWLEQQLSAAAALPRDRRPLEIGPEARFATTTDGQRIDLSRRGPTRRLLECLAQAREERPGEGVSVQALIDAGWPGERMAHASAVDRVYAAIRQLRLLGFDSCLLTHDDGYLIDPDVVLYRSEK